MSDFKLLTQRKIVDILMGDVVILEKEGKQFRLPYLSGPRLCELSTKFGLERTYTSCGGMSRCLYLTELIKYLDRHDTVGDLIKYLFDFGNFNDVLSGIHDSKTVKAYYSEIIASAISMINVQLLYSHKELRSINSQFVFADIGESVII